MSTMMPDKTSQRNVTRYEITAWIITGVLLIYVLKFHLLAALLAGLLVYELVHMLARIIHIPRLSHSGAKIAAVALLATVIISLLTLAIFGTVNAFQKETGGVHHMAQKMIEIVESSRTTAPTWLSDLLPRDIEELKNTLIRWARAHAGELQVAGKEAGRVLVHILIGMIIGAMIALREVSKHRVPGPLAVALIERADRVGGAFRRIVFAQVRIAALNAFFTWLYIGVTLPLLGISLPFKNTLILITFVAGLLPVLGNLISNTVIVIVSLSHSLLIAASSLAFLVVIHKLEYFLNARIIGTQIRSKAWELLLAMLVMEAGFGVAGVIAAPIYYAYVKDELTSRKLI